MIIGATEQELNAVKQAQQQVPPGTKLMPIEIPIKDLFEKVSSDIVNTLLTNPDMAKQLIIATTNQIMRYPDYMKLLAKALIENETFMELIKKEIKENKETK